MKNIFLKIEFKIFSNIVIFIIKFILYTILDQPRDGSYDDGKLVIITDSQVIAIKLHRCNSDKITSCSECVALQDPYCGWDKIAGKCRSHGAPKWLEETYFYQNVSTGQHAACPSGKMSSKDANAGEQKGKNTNPFNSILLYHLTILFKLNYYCKLNYLRLS